jgi:hypothetical protein
MNSKRDSGVQAPDPQAVHGDPFGLELRLGRLVRVHEVPYVCVGDVDRETGDVEILGCEQLEEPVALD